MVYMERTVPGKNAYIIVGELIMPINYNIVDKREGDPAEIYAKAEFANKMLGWQPKFSDLEMLIASTWKLYHNI